MGGIKIKPLFVGTGKKSLAGVFFSSNSGRNIIARLKPVAGVVPGPVTFIRCDAVVSFFIASRFLHRTKCSCQKFMTSVFQYFGNGTGLLLHRPKPDERFHFHEQFRRKTIDSVQFVNR